MNFRPFAAACLASVLLAACSTVPQPLQGEFNQITPREAVELDSTGALVRWGGRIVQVEPKENRTCFEMISTRLNANEIGRAHVRTPVTNAHHVCRLLLEKKKHKQ